MIERICSKLLREIWSVYPVLTVTGPRQSGKTTLVKSLFPECEYVNFELPDIRALALSDPRGFLSMHSAPVIFDEIQYVPQLVSYIQGISDEAGRNSMFVLTGSYQPELQRLVSQSLAGRTGLFDLLPLSKEELDLSGVRRSRFESMFSGFYPRLFSSRISPRMLYADYCRTYVERDLRQLSNLRNMSQFERFMALLAGRIGQILNLESLSGDVGVSANTVKEWISLLEASYIVKTLRPYYRNFGKRFIKSPKIYFTDVGLASYLLGIEKPDQLKTHPLAGNLFENMVVMEIIKNRLNSGESGGVYYMRTSAGVEADLVIEHDGKLDLIEIKSSATFNASLSSNLVSLHKAFASEIGKMQVIYNGPAAIVNNVEYKNYDTY